MFTIFTVVAGIWLAGCALLTFGFLSSIQSAIGQSGGVLALAGLVALFFVPVRCSTSSPALPGAARKCA